MVSTLPLILHFWLGFNILLILSFYLPHWENASPLLWINESLYFMLFLLSASVAARDRVHRDIFIFFCIFLLANAFAFLNIYMGTRYWLGDDYFAYLFLHFKKLLIAFLFDLIIVYVTLKHLWPHIRILWRFLAAVGTIGIVFVVCFHPYLVDINRPFELGDTYRPDLYRRIFWTEIPAILSMGLYSILLYKKDRVLGQHIHSLMACIFLFLAVDGVANISEIHNLSLYTFNQSVLFITLTAMGIVLFRRFRFIGTEYGQFYESLLQNRLVLSDIPIQRYRSPIHASAIRWVKQTVVQNGPWLFVTVVLLSLAVGSLRPPKVIVVGTLTIISSLAILTTYMAALSQKRNREGHLLPILRRSTGMRPK